MITFNTMNSKYENQRYHISDVNDDGNGTRSEKLFKE